MFEFSGFSAPESTAEEDVTNDTLGAPVIRGATAGVFTEARSLVSSSGACTGSS